MTAATTNPVTTVREAVADAIETARLGLTMSPHIPDGAAGFPFGFVMIDATRRHRTRSNILELDMSVVVVTSAMNTREGQEALDALIASGGIVEALRTDPTFGGACSDSSTSGDTESLDLTQVADVEGWAHRWRLRVLIETA